MRKTRRLLKYFLGLTVIFLLLIIGYRVLCSVHARRSAWMEPLMEKSDRDFWANHDADGNGVPNEEQALQYAKSMLNVPFDPFMGKYSNLLGKAGFVVCIDVPVRSYLWAGVSLPALLKQSVKSHPEWFHLGPDNSPDNPFFYRRVRNYYDLFQNHPHLEAAENPQPGDLAFYHRSHITMVLSVQADGKYKQIEANALSARVAITDSDFLLRTRKKAKFFGRIRYSDPPKTVELKH